MADYNRRNTAVQAPTHPVTQLQGPFEESMVESVHDDSDADIFLDPVVRRNTLLEAQTYTRVVAGRWKQKQGERFHPLWKLIAQISFGVHLLAEGMAKSEDEVMQILQAHVDEIDGFLERTTEDFDLAQDDIQERLRCLKLPLSHPATFEKMLEDRNFRLSIVEGNEKIEHIVDRTTQATKDSLKDVQKGFDSTSCLEEYLRGLDHTWIRQTLEHEAVFVAMLGNVEGWRKAFTSLHVQGGKLGGSLKKLTDIINEMQSRAGEVSRRLLHQARGYGGGNDSHTRHSQRMGRPGQARNTPVSRFQTLPNKQLPSMPDRPPLRQAVSSDTIISQQSMRMRSSPDNVRHQSGVPAAQHVKPGISPKIIQIGAGSQARVQSMVPSLVESVPSPPIPSTNTTSSPQMHSLTIDEEEQPERYFPPVELPAHVPEETMRQAPMSKQNRLSLGLGLIQSTRSEKRASRLGSPASALVDLLRKPSSHRSSVLSQTPTSSNSPQASRQPSGTIPTVGVDKPTAPTMQIPSPDLVSKGETTTSSFSKNNVRRPKKGAQHWFDAHEDDENEDDKFSVHSEVPTQTKTLVVQSSLRPAMEHDLQPGTPSWAKTTFGQIDKKRADLKRGAFSSHPPDLPPGSPPLGNETKFANPLTVVSSRRTTSHASSSGTLGEPGPAFTASEAGSIKQRQDVLSNGQDLERSSATAPEVVGVQNVPPVPPMPPPPKQFVAEMEGSLPITIPVQTSIPTFAMELEAPQQYFKLPPRVPNAPKRKPLPSQEPVEIGKNDESKTSHEQTFKLPPRPQVSEEAPEASSFHKEPAKQQRAEKAVNVRRASEAQQANAVDVQQVLEANTTSPASTHTTKNDKSEGCAGKSIIQQTISITAEPNQGNDYLLTPQIPLPPSPLSSEVTEGAEVKEKVASSETLFLLPAVAYKAPVSPKFDTDKLETQPVSPSYRSSPPQMQRSSPKLSNTKTSSPSLPRSVRPSPTLVAPKAADPALSIVTSMPMQRDTRPAELKHTRNTSSHGSQNGWKAFFTGQPSPVGSNLSIRSIRRESAIGPGSPTLQVPDSASNRFPSSPVATSAKDVVWFNKPFDDMKPMSRVTSAPSSAQNVAGDGLGIKGLNGNGDVHTQTVRAA